MEPSIRDDLVDAAIKFLTNPKVKSTTPQDQRNFLIEKGLTEPEIDFAFNEVGKHVLPQPIVVEQQSFASKIQSLFIWCGAIYGTYNFIRYLILPRFFQIFSEDKIKSDELEKSIIELQNSIKFLIDSTSQTLKMTEEQSKNISTMLQHLSQARENDHNSNQIQNDISVVKQLLLGKDQFPSINLSGSQTAFTPFVSPALVPDWQLPTKKLEKEELEDSESDTFISA
uniref:Peroxisomal membrane protein PEX14 n=1 Tax=Rhabditophanes sp. KR3021 TaxID=114890 RepID=A0AC35TMW5_9BILA